MTATIIGVGVTLLVAILGVWRDVKGDLADVRSEIRDVRTDLGGEIGGARGDIVDLRHEIHSLAERVSRIEGRLDERDRHDHTT